MKNIFRVIALAIIVMASSNAAFAQEGSKSETAKEQRLSREELAVAQAKHIAQDLGFADDVTEKFVETFCNCQKEIWALGPRQKAEKKDMTEEETEAMLKERFAKSEKILSIRQKYYEEYSTFLTQTQIEQVYDQEKKMMKRLAERHQGSGQTKGAKSGSNGQKRGGNKK